MRREVFVQHGLKRGHGQKVARAVQSDARLVVFCDKADFSARRRAEAARAERFAYIGGKARGVHAEQHPVNGFKRQRRGVEVDDFHQREARGVGFFLRFRKRRADFLPARLGGG